jgi:hypothetical protein
MKNVSRLVGRLTLFFWTLETGKACSASRSSHDVLVALAIAFIALEKTGQISCMICAPAKLPGLM